MTQEEILEYNKRCAEFLGMYDYSKDNEYFEKGNYYCYPEKERNPSSGYFTILQKTNDGYNGIFNSDWNWIMEVVEAIEKLGNNDFQINIFINVANIRKFNKKYDCYEGFQYSRSSSKKEAVVQAINKFLIWYNNEKYIN